MPTRWTANAERMRRHYLIMQRTGMQASTLDALLRAERALRRLGDAECSYPDPAGYDDDGTGLSYSRRRAQIERRVERALLDPMMSCDEAIREMWRPHYQTDPRGCALYLVRASWSDDHADRYHNDGIAICD